MSTLNPTHKISRRHELREDKVITFSARAWQFFDQNKPLVYGALAALVALVLLGAGWAYYQTVQQDRALAAMSGAVRAYELGDYRTALDGNDAFGGLLTIIDEYGSTDAANLATFYAADAFYRLGEFDAALEYFDDFDADDNLLGASALAGKAAIYELQENYEQAGDLYRRAALIVASAITTPQYLLSAARAYEAAGAFGDARDAYETLREQFPEAPAARNLDVYLARLDAKSQN